MPLCHRPSGLREFSEFFLFALLEIVLIEVIGSAGWPVGMTACLQLDQVPLEPADAFLLGIVKRRYPAVLWRAPGRNGVQSLEARRSQEVAKQER